MAAPLLQGSLAPREWLAAQAPPVRFGIVGVGAFAAITLAVAIFNTVKKSRSPHAQRKRNVNKNKMVVERIDEYLPDRREELTPSEHPAPPVLPTMQYCTLIPKL